MYFIHRIMERYEREKERFDDIISSINIQEAPAFYGSEDKWLACEEIVLLTSMQHYSFGNWPLLAEILSKKFTKEFTPEEVRDHYINTYMEGGIAEAMKTHRQNKKLKHFKSFLKDHTSKEHDELFTSADIDAYENVPPEFLTEIGYIPLREEFKEEYAQGAENLIFNLSFKNTDTYDKNVNLIVLDAYRHKIKERFIKKKALNKGRLVEKYYASYKPSFKKKLHDNKLLNSPNSILSESPHELPKLDEVNNLIPRRVTRSNFKIHSAYKNLEEKGKSLSPRIFSPHNNNSQQDLTSAERKLCTDLDLKIGYYLHYKTFLRRDPSRVSSDR